MPEIAINVDRLYKRFRLGGKPRADTLRDVVTRKGTMKASERTDFWAVSNVSFEVTKGQVMGIVGPNGSGKSTILKILSRVMEPTHGGFHIEGRSASLLEVGSGFHPELTGRENVQFNGAVLGMTRREIAERTDQIFEWAGVEAYRDVPVKHYSSGMYVRLAFSVATFLDPDVMFIDEALAVGDHQFQLKCMERMRDVTRSGKTTVVVTHSLSFVEQFCDSAIYLNEGRLLADGAAGDVVSAYLGRTVERLDVEWTPDPDSTPDPTNPVVPRRVRLLARRGEPAPPIIARGDELFAEITFDVLRDCRNLSVGVNVLTHDGVKVLRTSPTDADPIAQQMAAGPYTWRVQLPSEYLSDGKYIVAFDADLFGEGWIHNPYHTAARTKIEVHGALAGHIGSWDKDREGVVKVPLPWTLPRTTGAR